MLPIWKHGVIASEPLSDWEGKPAFLIDAASRPGMSGSPVLRRTFGPAAKLEADGSISIRLDSVVASEFVGVYAGHLTAGQAEITVGYAFYGRLVGKMLEFLTPGTRE